MMSQFEDTLRKRAREGTIKEINYLKDKFKDNENVAILPLSSREDIQRITMGELEKSLI